MASNTSKLSVSQLDFDFIKQNLVTYLQSQNEFSDYNFEGAAMNVLMDILSYNTHMNAYMANMMANEMFLDSASIRQSVVSKAKEIGYTPRSVRSSVVPVNVYINNVAGSPQQISLPAGTIFDTNFKYTFATKDDYILYPSKNESTTYEALNIDLYDGNYVEFHYTVNFNDPDQQFIIPSEQVDMSTIRVFVQPDKTSSQITEYFINDDINRLKPDTKVFFTHETPEGFYEITFGDGILGNKLINNNYITLTYIIAKGKEEANNIVKFIPIVDISGYGSIVIETISPSYGGSEKESIDDIKFLAPKMFQSQRRAVTIEDYETFLLHDYPWIDTINSWGGEYNEPPIYGKVFFAIKPKHTEFISSRLKEDIIEDLIKKYNVVTIIPEILDPEYIYIVINTDVYYNQYETVTSNSELENKTIANINGYFDNTTKKFKMNFNFSPMVGVIDNTDPSFISSLSNITIGKRIYPKINSSETISVNFNNPIVSGSIDSTFINPLVDAPNDAFNNLVIRDKDGILQLVNFYSDIIVDSNIGTVDYNTGNMSFSLFVNNLPLDTLDVRVYAIPVSKNIKSAFNQIIVNDQSSFNNSVNRRQGISVTINRDEA